MAARLVAKMRFEKIAGANYFGRQLFKPEGIVWAFVYPVSSGISRRRIGHVVVVNPREFIGLRAGPCPNPV